MAVSRKAKLVRFGNRPRYLGLIDSFETDEDCSPTPEMPHKTVCEIIMKVVFGLVLGAILVLGGYCLIHLATITVNTFRAEAQSKEPAHRTETVHKDPSEGRSQAEAVNAHASRVPETALAVEKDAVIEEAIVTRLLEQLQRGEITLQPGACSSDAEKKQKGGCGSEAGEVKVTNVTNVTQVTNVTHVTRLQYQCLLSDKIRWRLLEIDLRKAVAEEMEAKMADMQAETDSKMEMLAHKTRESRAVGEEQRSRVDEMVNRLLELESRLALEPQIMEIRGFMKIDSFGPVLLAMGILHMLEILLVCVLLARLG